MERLVSKDSYIKTSNLKLRKAMFQAFNGKCFYSGAELDDFEIDHIVPKSKGGLDCISNYLICRKDLNRSKYNNFDENITNIILNAVNLIYSDKVVKILNSKIKKESKHKISLQDKINQLGEARKLNCEQVQEKTKQKLNAIIENWDFEKLGKITQISIVKNHPISKKTVEKYYKIFIEYIKITNSKFGF